MLKKLSTALVIFAAAQAGAATVVWSPASNIAGDSDVSVLGTSVYAYTFGPAGQTDTSVNGVTFTGFPVPFNSDPITIGSVTARETSGPSAGLSFGGSTSAPYSNLTAGYKGLLNGFLSSGIVEAAEVTMGGLTPGQLYQVQAWGNVSGADATLVVRLDTSTFLDTNTTNTEGGLGQYAIGTFVADSTSQIFTQSGFNGQITGPFTILPALNGFQLRAIPEPASLGLLGIGAMGLLARRRSP